MASSHQILLNLDPDLVSSPLGAFNPLLQWRRRVLQLLLHQVLWSELVTSGYETQLNRGIFVYTHRRKRAGFHFWVICWSVSVYLQLSFFLLQHFPEYLSGMFLYFWVLKHTFTTNIVNKYDNLYSVLVKNNSIWDVSVHLYCLILNIMSLACSGLGPVILWEGVLLSPEGKGGGGGGGASPPRDVLWLGEMSVGRGSKGKAAVEGGGPCSVRATYVPAERRIKVEWAKRQRNDTSSFWQQLQRN